MEFEGEAEWRWGQFIKSASHKLAAYINLRIKMDSKYSVVKTNWTNLGTY